VLVGVGLGNSTAVGVGVTGWRARSSEGMKLQAMLSATATLTTQMTMRLLRPELRLMLPPSLA
jgi:hypothetical protein